MKKRMTLADIPELPGYVPVAAVAAKYGVHKGTIYYMIYTQLAFKNIFKVTTGEDDPRPLLLLDVKEVEEVFAERARNAAIIPATPLAQLVREWNRRVKDWGKAEGWTQTPIAVSGPAHRVLVDAYIAANPNDPRPE